MANEKKHKILTYLIAIIWLINGLVCKILNVVPRHQQIVAKILGVKYSKFFILSIGFFEIVMAIWILTKFKSKVSAIIQIIVVVTMNVLEFIYCSDLLLFGRFNLVFALFFSSTIYYNEFVLNKKLILIPK